MSVALCIVMRSCGTGREKQMPFDKLPAIEGGYQHAILPMDAMITVGFGDASVTKDGETIWSEMENARDAESWDDFWTTAKAEEAARKDPDHDWRIHLVAPLSERHYQRQGEDHWVLYEKGIGFA